MFLLKTLNRMEIRSWPCG